MIFILDFLWLSIIAAVVISTYLMGEKLLGYKKSHKEKIPVVLCLIAAWIADYLINGTFKIDMIMIASDITHTHWEGYDHAYQNEIFRKVLDFLWLSIMVAVVIPTYLMGKKLLDYKKSHADKYARQKALREQ
jgi:branched-subunit amino acid transport protein